jgi:hypothetical protein
MKLRLVLVLFVALWAASAFGQGCAMCYSSAAATNKDGQRALSRAVLVMLVLPLSVMTAGLRWAFWYGKKRDEEKE